MMNNVAIIETFLLYSLLTFIGLCLGSFFNVLIWRIPRGESIAFPSSHCPKCKSKIKFYDNIPVLSYMILGGKCRKCGVHISIIYPMIEILTAVVLILAWIFLDVNAQISNASVWYELLLPFARVVSMIFIIPISIIDIRHYIIPNRFTIPFFVIALALSFIPGDITPLQSLIGALAGGGILFLFGVIGSLIFKKDAMGMGDIKLMLYLGALWGYEIALAGIMFGAVLGTIASAILFLLKKMRNDRMIPFGPFLCCGVAIAAIYGMPLVEWYLSLIT